MEWTLYQFACTTRGYVRSIQFKTDDDATAQGLQISQQFGGEQVRVVDTSNGNAWDVSYSGD
jgi:mRNA-degrading endonuclease toxin of MazEF toxin-antitoxin module